MNARKTFGTAVLLCLLAVACAPPAEQEEPSGEQAMTTEADVAAIRDVMDRWTIALNTEDTDAMLALLTEDTQHLGPNEPALRGHAAVGSWFDAMFAEEGAPVFSIETTDVRVASDWAVGQGVYSWTVPAEGGEEMTVPGKWMILFERGADGAWRAASTIWNLDVPEPSSS